MGLFSEAAALRLFTHYKRKPTTQHSSSRLRFPFVSVAGCRFRQSTPPRAKKGFIPKTADRIKAGQGEKVFTQTYKILEDMQAKVTEVLLSYSETAIAKLTGFSHFINAANEI